MKNSGIIVDKEYIKWFAEVKQLVKSSQLKAAIHVNTELLHLYWKIGEKIVSQQAEAIWGTGFYKTMSLSLKSEFPGMEGFSVTNLKYMKKFYLFYSDSNRQQPVDDLNKIHSIPWGHHILIFTKCKRLDEALFYVDKTLENGWSRSILLNFLDTGLYDTQGKAINNFKDILSDEQSDLAKETLKAPYNFDFLMIREGYKEKDLEEALTDNITKFLLELGQGFAFVGRQVPLMVGNREMVMDLLFYHLNLRCYVVVDLKICEFEPSFIGQLGTYIVAVNHKLKKEWDNSTLGLII